MKNLPVILSFILLNGYFVFTEAQNCKENIGFEQGNTSKWVCKWGCFGKGVCPNLTHDLFNATCLHQNGVNASLTSQQDKHVIVTGSNTDPNSLNTVPLVAPASMFPGGINTYSFRLGNDNIGQCIQSGTSYAQAEGMYYTFIVTQQNSIFTFLISVFIDDAGHPPGTGAKVSFNIYKKFLNKDSLIPCQSIIFAPNDTSVKYMWGIGGYAFSNWIKESINLTEYINDTITVEFATNDCMPPTGPGGCNTPAPGTHSAYAYLDAYCQAAEVGYDCTASSDSVQLCAPDGFKKYIWYPGDGINDTVKTRCVILPKPVSGSYTVKMFSLSGCTSEMTQNIFCTVSVPESYKNIRVKVFPNPFTDKVRFEISGTDEKSFSLFIYDALGRIVNKLDKITTPEFILDRNEMENGIYFYELKTENTIIGRGKLILK